MSNDKGKQIPVVKIRFNLNNPVSIPMYNYLQEKTIVTDAKPKKKNSIVSVQQTIDFEPKIVNPIPYYNFYAAAGTFSEMQSENEYTLIEGPANYSSNNDYFACKVIGESMNRVIPNGSVCLFKIYTGGSRNGKIVLVEHFDRQDPDFNSAFTI